MTKKELRKKFKARLKYIIKEYQFSNIEIEDLEEYIMDMFDDIFYILKLK